MHANPLLSFNVKFDLYGEACCWRNNTARDHSLLSKLIAVAYGVQHKMQLYIHKLTAAHKLAIEAQS